MSNNSEHSSTETSPKHMGGTSEQAEDVSKDQAPVADSSSQTGEDNSGKFFLELIGVVILIVAVVSIGATSCGTASHTTETETESYSGGSRGGETLGDDDSDGSSSGGSDDHSYGYSDRDYSSTDDNDEYQHVYDEDSGIYGVIGEDGDGLFAGEDFGMRLNEDGSSIATDGNGNWVIDSDGDGEIDSVSIDGGNTWF